MAQQIRALLRRMPAVLKGPPPATDTPAPAATGEVPSPTAAVVSGVRALCGAVDPDVLPNTVRFLRERYVSAAPEEVQRGAAALLAGMAALPLHRAVVEACGDVGPDGVTDCRLCGPCGDGDACGGAGAGDVAKDACCSGDGDGDASQPQLSCTHVATMLLLSVSAPTWRSVCEASPEGSWQRALARMAVESLVALDNAKPGSGVSVLAHEVAALQGQMAMLNEMDIPDGQDLG